MIDDPSGSGRVTVGALGWTAFGAGLLGVLLLPNSSGYGYHYEAIRTIEMRDRFHLTTDMVRSYNRDLQRVNVVVNEIQGVLADLNVTYTEAEATNVSKRIWAERLIDFSPATRTALHNINSVIQAQN